MSIIGLTSLIFGRSIVFFAIGLLTHGILIGVTFTASIFYSLYIENSSGKHTGVHEAIIGSGFLLGPLVGGFLAEQIGPRAPYLLSGCVILCAILFQTYLLKKGIKTH